MLEIIGKYNRATVFLDYVEDEVTKQIYNFLNNPAFANSKIRIMPDAHAGSGSCIGFTMTMNDYIIPNVIGVDIGCGVDCFKLGKINADDKLLSGLDNYIRRHIPNGFNNNQKIVAEFEGDHLKFDDEIKDVCDVVENKKGENLSASMVLKSIGSLGGGNHFIELNKDSQDDLWLTVHSGSRNFGLQVANYHQRLAKEYVKNEYNGASAYQGLEYLKVGTAQADSYIKCMQTAQEMAVLNRATIAERIINNFFCIDFKNCSQIVTTHNYINFSDKIIRKGAIASYLGEKIIIPLNMRDGSIICEGKANANWNYSAPHGAGRILGRKQAKKQLTLNEFQDSMKDVWSTSVNEKTLDESPMAYKNKKLILENIGDTANALEIIKPIYNFKAD